DRDFHPSVKQALVDGKTEARRPGEAVQNFGRCRRRATRRESAEAPEAAVRIARGPANANADKVCAGRSPDGGTEAGVERLRTDRCPDVLEALQQRPTCAVLPERMAVDGDRRSAGAWR